MLNPETALDSWRGWDAPLDTRPVVIRELGEGRSNRSFLLETGSEKMVLRVNSTPTALPNPDRAVEARVWRVASEAGIAPRLLYTHPQGEFLVSAYIENELPGRPQDYPGLTEQALELLQRCHWLDVDAPIIDYTAHIERYWQVIERQTISPDPSLVAQRILMDELLEELCSAGAEKGLCHHDPVVENFVGSHERLYLIDWEYAARGLRVLDYAALVVEWGMDEDAIIKLTGSDSESLTRAKSLYRYMCSLWEATRVLP